MTRRLNETTTEYMDRCGYVLTNGRWERPRDQRQMESV